MCHTECRSPNPYYSLRHHSLFKASFFQTFTKSRASVHLQVGEWALITGDTHHAMDVKLGQSTLQGSLLPILPLVLLKAITGPSLFTINRDTSSHEASETCATATLLQIAR